MNKDEEAIEYLSKRKELIERLANPEYPMSYAHGKLELSLINTAIEALREMMEREKGCQYCDEGNLAYYYAGNIPNFCKHCGRKLKENENEELVSKTDELNELSGNSG